jgi:hypothetical protein
MNPVNAYLRPHREQIFAEFTGQGWLRFADGGAAEGSYLAHHPDMDEVLGRASRISPGTCRWQHR